MKSGWKVVLILVLAAIAIGVLCIVVGNMAGADFTRIWATLDDRYHVEMYYNYLIEVYNTLQAELI